MKRFVTALLVMAASWTASAQSLTGIAAISSGSAHNCALTESGRIQCWGALDDDLGGIRVTPVDIGLQGEFKAISAGAGGGCALSTASEVRCWGDLLPPYSPASEAVAAVSVGGSQACVLTLAGGVKCWSAGHEVPVEVAGLQSGVIAISVGGSHACALMATGNVKCWGSNNFVFLSPMPIGVIGDGTNEDRPTPVDVVDLAGDIVAIHAGTWNTCAITSGGGLKCWGWGFGNRPVDVPGLGSGVASVASGGALGPRISLGVPPIPYNHICALMVTGGVKCWGSNQFGQLGDGTDNGRNTFADVSGLASGAVAVTAGANHSCALMDSGQVRCWGGNTAGQLGDGTISEHARPIPPSQVPGLGTGLKTLGAGEAHTCVRQADGPARCWGANTIRGRIPINTGALGDGTFINRPSPVDVLGMVGLNAIATGSKHSCGLSSSSVFCWGLNDFGQVGDGLGQAPRTQAVPVATSNPAGVQPISGGAWHTCAITEFGSVNCWGLNSAGQLGDGTQINRPTPVPISVGGPISGVAAGGQHTCAFENRVGGSAWCWGSNSRGQLGDGTTTDRLVPTKVPAVLNSGTMTAGAAHTCDIGFLFSGLRCWGANDRGQLGIGTREDQLVPAIVQGLPHGTIIMAAAGNAHTCALVFQEGVFCWGANESGQVGDGTRFDRTLPVRVKGLEAFTVDWIAAGARHTCAAVRNGPVLCWGANEHGQLGIGFVTIPGARPLAAPVVTASPLARLANISTRALVSTGDNVMIAGFIVDDASSSKTVVINVAGPSLAGSGVTTTLTNPSLTLVRSSDQSVVATNDDWQQAANAAEIEESGFAPNHPSEPAILATLPPGAYTAIVRGAGSETGTALVGVFEVDHPESPLVNISTRGRVQTENDVMIAGFIIHGSESRTVVVNAAGPSLGQFGITNRLVDPVLILVRSSDGAIMATNDNWQQSASFRDIADSGFAPNDPNEPAIIATLPPGAYTAIVHGKDGGSGIALVGVFAVP